MDNINMSCCSHLIGKTFSVTTLGCRVNHYEAEAVAGALENRGAVLVEASPDIVITVTCSITSTADAKTRKALRRARRDHPDSVIVACGCWAQAATESDAVSAGVDILVGNRVKHVIVDALERWYESPGIFIERKTDVVSSVEWDALSLDRPRMLTRAFIKVQDGCDRSCSYCAVPSLRGAHVSRDPDDVVREISRVASFGTKEAILTGIQLGSYGLDGVTLAGLIRKISDAGAVTRLRLGSLEPFSVTEELLQAASDSEIFCRHLHLPLQSGDDGVLRAMRRGYDAADFIRIVDMARRYLGDDAHISTDLIVGFPGESDDAFERSLALLGEVGLGRIHVFPYSRRNGTDSSAMEGVPGNVLRERMNRALRVADGLLEAYAAKLIGREDRVLVEEVGERASSGWNTRYVRVYARTESTGNCLIGNELVVRPKYSNGSILLCEGVDGEKIIMYPDE
ncbi:MAG: MiaB/RimO family radical SAM methylthiotransferase [Synergistaceae bacterium]|jgi:threonylcarbamoyladenosine tRNA methylthiotransferase MtaB|nr:MiaB/RimO family radical SAM methylthiotransferase [Synergistaceae bacterium]